jgi:hypothetical protein
VPKYPKSQNIHYPHPDKVYPNNPSSSVSIYASYFREIKEPPDGAIWRQEKKGIRACDG